MRRLLLRRLILLDSVIVICRVVRRFTRIAELAAADQVAWMVLSIVRVLDPSDHRLGWH